jgi:hypothetical protein
MATDIAQPFRGVSAFEQFLFHLDKESLYRSFSRFTPDIIFSLACTNFAVHNLVREYVIRAWNIETFLQRWFPDPAGFRQALNACRAIVGGMPALQFMDRGQRDVTVFDIFLRFDGLLGMGRYLIQEGYNFQYGRNEVKDWDTVAFTLSGKLRFDVHRRDPNNDFVSGVIRSFRFHRVCRYRPHGLFFRSIRLTLLRIDPIKWILSAQSSECTRFCFRLYKLIGFSAAAMTFLTASHAVSLFPRATFIDRKTYICRKVTRVDSDASRDWVNGYFGTTYRTVPGPYLGPGIIIPGEVTTAARQVGDAKSWVIKLSGGMLAVEILCRLTLTIYTTDIPNSNVSAATILSLCFEVLDFRSRVVAPGAFLRIAEPFVLRRVTIISRFK